MPAKLTPRREGLIDMTYFEDRELLIALGMWLFTTAGWRAKIVKTPQNKPLSDIEIVLLDLTVQDVRAEDIKLRLALLIQPADLERLIETTQFAEGAYPLLKAAWGQQEKVAA